MDEVTPLDLKQEGRISILEVKVDRMYGLVEDLHTDMQRRKDRWSLLTGSIRYLLWVVAGALTVIGVGKTPSLAGWLQAYPSH
jgi:predicted branched-subunit amino acid permease